MKNIKFPGSIFIPFVWQENTFYKTAQHENKAQSAVTLKCVPCKMLIKLIICVIICVRFHSKKLINKTYLNYSCI